MTHSGPLPVICPDCGARMILRTTIKFSYRNGQARKFWGCSRFPDCMATHGAHPDGSPCGIPGTAEVKALRIEAHGWFDRLWKLNGNKKAAYKWLSLAMKLPREKAHIGMFDADQCRVLIEKLKAKFSREAVKK